ncbi:MAG: GSCFA domain-containing protein [Dysgonamonadaceae bacterium]|jgi:hypothetical protein|nr:GSCFA domain-containing protein [Dysgonamonadaceae bacterium]
MNFRTEISLAKPDFGIKHSDKIMSFGSCFSENISEKLIQSGFCVDANPFGVLFNPASISKNIRKLVESTPFSEDDICENKGVFFSFSHHSRFSGRSREETLEKINLQWEASRNFLRQAGILIVTFGTSYVYSLKSNGEIVANCHKLPASNFTRKRLTVEEIYDDWAELVPILKSLNVKKIIFTVSPVRHLSDGFHENQVSKAVLLLAIEALAELLPDAVYFPAYEILLDDLRDYRFYADDLLHPSTEAVNYVWEKFSETFFDAETADLAKEFENLNRALNHRPFNPDAEEYRRFMEKNEQKRLFLSEKVKQISARNV